MKKKLLSLLAIFTLFICILPTTSCGSSSSGDASGTILMTYSYGDSFLDNLAASAQEYAESAGVTLETADAASSIETQVSQIQSAADSGYSAIICVPVDADTAKQLQAAAGDLPIIFANTAPDEDTLEADKYIYVGSDEETAGQYQAQYVLDNTSGDANVVLIMGPSGHSGAEGRSKGVEDTFATEGGANIVFKDYGDWSSDNGAQLFEIFLRTGQNVDAVLCNNDTMALGVIEACKENGIDPSSIIIAGVDASEDGCTAIKEGTMSFTVYQSSDEQGKACAEAAIALGSGGSIKSIEYAEDNLTYIYVPFEQVDSSNVSSYQ